jgi:Xaa-Pro dipeptidase
MRERGLDGMLCVSPENLTYISGYQTFGYYRWQGMVVPADGLPTLVVRALEASNVQTWSWLSNVVPIEESADPMVVLADVLRAAGLQGTRLGVELDSWFITNRQFASLRDLSPETVWVDAGGLVEALRVIKSPAEVAYIREACVQAAKMMRAGWDAISVGASELTLASAVLSAQGAAGAEPAGLPPFVVSGPRTGIPHATWSDRILEPGDPVLLELAGTKQRYCGALARTAFVGKVEPRHRILCAISLDVLDAAIASARPGSPANAVEMAVRDILRDHQFDGGVPHRAGYSVGLNWPPDWGEGNAFDLSENEGRTLQPGMTFHITGSLLFSEGYLVGLSETILITDSGAEVLTSFPREFPIL